MNSVCVCSDCVLVTLGLQDYCTLAYPTSGCFFVLDERIKHLKEQAIRFMWIGNHVDAVYITAILSVNRVSILAP